MAAAWHALQDVFDIQDFGYNIAQADWAAGNLHHDEANGSYFEGGLTLKAAFASALFGPATPIRATRQTTNAGPWYQVYVGTAATFNEFLVAFAGTPAEVITGTLSEIPIQVGWQSTGPGMMRVDFAMEVFIDPDPTPSLFWRDHQQTTEHILP